MYIYVLSRQLIRELLPYPVKNLEQFSLNIIYLVFVDQTIKSFISTYWRPRKYTCK